MIHYNSLFSLSVVLETSRPALKGLKAERKRILPWCKTIALIYHHFIFDKHIPSLKILHSKVFILRSFDILWTMIITPIFLGLAI